MTDIDKAAARIAEAIKAEAAEIGDSSYEKTIWKAAGFWLAANKPGRPRDAEGVPIKWACRLMLFDDNDDIAADSQPDQELEATPLELFTTLRNVGAWARAAAYDFHRDLRHPEPLGLDEATIDRRILTARVAMHRHKGGYAWWKLPYTVGGQQWHAHIRIGRVSDDQIETAGRGKASFRTRPPQESSAPTS